MADEDASKVVWRLSGLKNRGQHCPDFDVQVCVRSSDNKDSVLA